MQEITITGARLHSLKELAVAILRNFVATSVSGSGKFSLVFGIVFEEGRKQYLRSLGRLLELDDEDRFDTIPGIALTSAVRKTASMATTWTATL